MEDYNKIQMKALFLVNQRKRLTLSKSKSKLILETQVSENPMKLSISSLKFGSKKL
jgi:hypothetical protein